MLKLTRRLGNLAASATLLSLPQLAHADFYFHGWEDQYENPRRARLDLQLGSYSSKDNFESTGTRFAPSTEFQKYSRSQTDLSAAYGLFRRLSVFGRLGYARAQLDHDNTAIAGTNSGLTEGSIGLTWRALQFDAPPGLSPVAVDVQIQADIPLYKNSDLTGPALGDSTTDITTGAFMSIPLVNSAEGRLILTGGAGLTLRSNSYSTAIPWSISTDYQPTNRGITGSVCFFGMESLHTDPRVELVTSDQAAAAAYSQSTGGSFISGAINPSLISMKGQVGYQFSRGIKTYVFASQSIWGQSIPNGLHAGIGIQARLGDLGTTVKHEESVDGSRLSPRDYGRANKGFINYGLEAHVTRSNDRLHLVKIDKGSQDGVAVGHVFDIFVVKKDGTVGEAIARGKVSGIQANEAALVIDEYFKEVWIDEGFVAKRPVQ